MASYLVIANQTLGGAELRAKLDELGAAGNVALHLVVPVSRTEGERDWEYPPTERTGPDAATVARWLAQARLNRELTRLIAVGVDATGEVVEHDPVERIRKSLDERQYDGIVVATLPQALSRWLLMDLPHRVTRLSTIPVTHVEGTAGPSL
ncbi:MAG TPA: universal stress protein [Jatrophihabitans sp.]|nr:universal stress protein [Jatrophihabitans sp.]